MNGIVHSLFSFPLNSQSQKDTKLWTLHIHEARGEREDREEGAEQKKIGRQEVDDEEYGRYIRLKKGCM